MRRNIDAAVKLYSGDKPIGLFADRLPMNLKRMNASFVEITAIFSAAGVPDFMKLPDDLAARAAFAKQFNQFSAILEAAKIQGFTWEKSVYGDDPLTQIQLVINHHQYLTLLQRYKELGVGGGGGGESIPFEIDSHITEIDTGKIDADYMNSRFDKYLKVLQGGNEQAKETTLAELHRSFSSLSQEEQRIAEIFLHDIQRGDVQIDAHRTFRDYLADYQVKAKNREIDTLVTRLGVDKVKLVALMNTHVTEANLNEFGRFDDLKATVDQQKAKTYFEGLESKELPLFRVNIRTANLLQDFIIKGGFLSS
jgi:type I restriction enzyme R subunit